jgi:hypothetical protein
MHLATYLNDHLSGATAALDLLEHLERSRPDLAAFLAALRRDIEEDRRELEALIHRVGAARSGVRQAAGWVAEQFARLKLAADDLTGGRLRLLESLEAVAVGIHGKGSLWRALKVVPAAAGPDYDRLIARADEQRGRVEAARLDAARAAFADG